MLEDSFDWYFILLCFRWITSHSINRFSTISTSKSGQTNSNTKLYLPSNHTAIAQQDFIGEAPTISPAPSTIFTSM